MTFNTLKKTNSTPVIGDKINVRQSLFDFEAQI